MKLPGLGRPEDVYSAASTALIIGAGLAGCAASRLLAKSGFNCVLYDQNDMPACGTSAVPRALYRPQVTRTAQLENHYFSHAFNCIRTEVSNVSSNCGSKPEGVLQLVKDASLWPDNEQYTQLTRSTASELAGTAVAGDALYFEDAGSVAISNLCNHWIAQSQASEFIGNTRVQSLRKTDYGWQLLDSQQNIINESPLVVISSAGMARQLAETAHLPLQKIRGQISYFEPAETSNKPTPLKIITGRCTVIPAAGGFWAGSTHQRDNQSSQLSDDDDQLNLQHAFGLCPELRQTIARGCKARRSWVGFRYSTPDRLPIAGAAPLAEWYRQHYADIRHGKRQQRFPEAKFHTGLYLLTGFGSRGALHSVLAAQTLVNIITGTPLQSDHPQAFTRLLHPGRFLIRLLRRGLQPVV